MGKLKDLHKLGELLRTEFEDVFTPDDVELPNSFKDSVKELGGYKYDYQRYLVHIYSDDLHGYIPNQWFIIASFFVDYYNEVKNYKALLVEELTYCGLTKTEDRKAIMSMYSTEIGKKPKEISFDQHKRETVAKVRQHISDVLCNDSRIDDNDKEYLIRFVSDYDWWYGGKTIDRGDFYVSPILALSKVVNASHSYIADICKSFAESKLISDTLKDWYTIGFAKSNDYYISSSNQHILQQIYYGAPGTGKSHTINEKTEGESVIRTTFHPDSDYSTFVGAYKPTMDLLPICNEIGQEMKLGNTVLHKEQIVYKFVSQAFLQAYVQAWKYYAEDAEEVKKQFLVIEEINRGNCAQIFGDLFQLLDRNDSGFSDYPIKADEDMKKYLSKELHDLEINNAEGINALYKGRNVVNEVINGDILLLPNNLYIWATMNTSDQSLFPIDSAFKRRWDWQYVPINKGYDKDGKEIQWVIEAGNKRYDWWDFLEKINHEIDDTTHSEDKKLGFFFCKAEDNIVSAEKFVSKVVFYLWNDVFKNYGFDKPFFKKEDGNTLAFSDFYESDNSGNTSVRADVVEMFLDKLKVYGVEAEFTSEANEIEPSTVIKVNGKQTKFKNEIPYTAIEEYVRLNGDKTAQEIYDIWDPFKKCSIRKWIVLNKEDYDKMNENERNYSYKIDCADGNSVWVNKDGWTYHPQKKNIKDSISAFIKAVHEANLGITITEESI